MNADRFKYKEITDIIRNRSWVQGSEVQARPGATTIIKEINPLLLKACALDPTS
jgi:hypothetical protein